MAEPTNSGRLRPVDAVGLARIAARLAMAPQAPWLHGEVARRMAERLPLIRRRPDCVLDWGSHLGASREHLAAAYPQARRIAVEAECRWRLLAAQRDHARWWSPRRWRGEPPVVGEHEVADAAADLLWSNMGLHLEPDIEALLARWRRCLATDGFLMFSTLGPGTLQRLRDLYRAQGWPPPMAPLVDMHDLGDMLVRAGFADPVMDQEPVTLSWPSAEALLAELRQLGGNADPGRGPGLRTPRWRQRLCRELEQDRDDQGRLRLSFEIVYGHAFCPAPQVRVAPRTTIGVEQLRAMARAGRAP